MRHGRIPEGSSPSPLGQGKMVKVGGKHIALFNIQGTYYAIDDTCTHKGGPLSEGVVTGRKVTCPWHLNPAHSTVEKEADEAVNSVF